MSDWRSNPRTGKSTFMPLLGDINDRIKLGETVKMIYESYIENGTIDMSYPQFTRYVKRYCVDEQKDKSVNTKKEKEQTKEDKRSEPIDNTSSTNDELLNQYLDVCFRNKNIAMRAIANSVPIEKIIEWKAPNATRLGTLLTNYIMNN
ncbi:TraK family protein [Serratia bockelmannii]|uniref:TraK family protein n=1 Tax=Serratia bockelmannii TaxID=2703793 RepID=UPI003FA77764